MFDRQAITLFNREGERGSALVQTALVFPVLLTLIFGFILFVPALRAGAVLQMASREAARAFALTDDAGIAYQRAKEELKMGLIDPEKAQITLTRNGNLREAKITLNYAIAVPFLEGRVYKPNGNAVFQLETYH